MMADNNNKPMNIFWTGGWDSTFRILQCVIVLKKTVQPHYLIDIGRKSLHNELKAIANIKEKLFKLFPYTQKLLLPIKFEELSNIPENTDINAAFNELREKIKLGDQYEWLSRYCLFNKISNMELSYEKGENSPKQEFVIRNLFLAKNNFGKTYKSSEKSENKPFHRLFSNFEWPLIETSREDMIEISKDYEFQELLYLTWFCHEPKKNKPCGICAPCTQAMEDNFGFRMPLISKIRYYLRVITTRRHFKKKFPSIYHLLFKLKNTLHYDSNSS